MDILDHSTVLQVIAASRDDLNPARAAQANTILKQWWLEYKGGRLQLTPECVAALGEVAA